MSSYEYSEFGEVSADEIVNFCRALNVLKPFCQPDRDIPGRFSMERPLADGRVAEVSITEVDAEIPSDEDPEVIESVDSYTIYSVNVAADDIDGTGKGTRIRKHYSVFEPAVAPEAAFEEADETYYLTNDAGANWHPQRSPLIDEKIMADIHLEHGEDAEADRIQREINAARTRAQELADMLGEGRNGRAPYLAAIAAVAAVCSQLGVRVE
jgi:hypothetical protein